MLVVELHELLHDADHELRQVITNMALTRDQSLRAEYTRLVSEFERGIRMTRNATIGIIALVDTAGRLATHLNQRITVAGANLQVELDRERMALDSL